MLCKDLLSTTEKLPRGDNGGALAIVLKRLVEWQELLRRRREQLLTREQTIGLVGELLFLKDEVFPLIGADAVKTWRGPFGDEQDFVHGLWIIEIKSQLSTSDKVIRISSESQLDTVSGNIALCHQTLGLSSKDYAASLTLNKLVEKIRDEVFRKDPPAALDFEHALIEVGYARRPEYDEPGWMLATRHTYTVSPGFPRITPTMLPVGVDKVTYSIHPEACKSFETDTETLMERIFVHGS